MSVEDRVGDLPSPGQTSLHRLVDEASRQLNICNACRYCEGFCAVFPALERRNLLTVGDVTQLANLCHDCRACFDACMYAPPHEFGINPPLILSQVRVENYRDYVWPRTVPRMLRGWTGVALWTVLASVIVLAVALGFSGPARLVASPTGAASPYDVIPYPALLALMLLTAAYSVVLMFVAGRRYWRDVGGAPDGLPAGAVARAVWDALTLRYLRGGGGDCYYPKDDVPTSSRRILHSLVAYGFGLCLVSTTSAGVLQDFLGVDPPYPWLSVPVITGTLGGIGMVVGCTGLLKEKARASGVTSFAEMTIKDYGLLVSLYFLAISGLATLLTRNTAAFGIVFLIHIASVAATFAAAPYSKFVHLVYRFLALVRDNVEARSFGR